MNQLKPTLQSITYIIMGELIQLAGAISDGWVSTLTIIFGIYLFFSGLNKLKSGLDANGQSGVGWLVIASIVSLVGSLIDFIPLMGLFASLVYMVAFVFQILGFMQLKKSKSIGEIGRGGVSLLFAAMGLAILGTLFSILPFVGGIMQGMVVFSALVCAVYGWLRIQEGLIDERIAIVNSAG
jgi:hypothetical protein